MKYTVLFTSLLFAHLMIYTHSVHLRQATTQAAANDNSKITEAIDAFCFLNQNGVVYDLNPISTTKDYTLPTLAGNLNFNVCANMNTPCPNSVGIASFNFKNALGTDECVQVAGTSSVSSKFYLIEDSNTLRTTIRMVLPTGDTCRSDNTKKYTTTLEFECDPAAEVAQVQTSPFNLNNCENSVSVKSKFACPKLNVYGLWNSVQENKYVFGTIILILGLFFCFVGENFLKITQVIAGGALSLIIFLYIIFNYTHVEINSWHFWLIIILSVAIGCAFGYFMTYITWLPGVVFGFLLGFIVGFVIFNICLRFINSNPGVVFWITMVVCCVAGVLLGFFKEEEISIISTSIVGAYAIIRGISIMAGGFPDERQVYELAYQGEWSQLSDFLTPVIYAYLAGFLILSALGMFIQFKFFYDGNKKKNNEAGKDKSKEPLSEESK